MRTLLTRLEQASGFDRAGDRVQGVVQTVLRPARLRDALHGVWLGHPLHPALVQVPLGAWISAAALDLLPGQRRAATLLVSVGTAGAVPAVLAGATDWATQSREQRRVGLVHALANTVGVAFYAGSMVARLRGSHRLGRILGYLGLAAAGGGAYLGGHLAYRQAAGVNEGSPDLHRISAGWHPLGALVDLPERTLLTREIDDVPVLVYRNGDRTTVLLARCAHQSGPLGAGELTEVDGRDCVVCPWHGSTFRLIDGRVVHGPAGTDQQVLPCRVTDGRLEARLP